MTEYAYDPASPYVVAGRESGILFSRFRHEEDAQEYADTLGFIMIDTTPKPKIPVDAQHITWGRKNAAYSRIDDRWYGWTDTGLSEGAMLELIGDAEVIVLVPKENG